MPDSHDKFRTIWLKEGDDTTVQVIDQRLLPHEYVILDLVRYEDGIEAIRDMAVRGAPLIGATAAYSVYLAALETDGNPEATRAAAAAIAAARPTAVNLVWAVERMLEIVGQNDGSELVKALKREAGLICDEDVEISLGIGRHGLELLRAIAEKKDGPVNVLTHCNAGALATINWGTATAPVYLAHAEGIDVHVWVDETRPRSQGSQLTVWELKERGVPHTLIVDNAGGHLMQHGQVDIVITGTDRTTRTGDVANKIGTYLKALAAHDNGIPFYVALPSTTIDWDCSDGVREIPIEERDGREVSHVRGKVGDSVVDVLTTPEGTPVGNPAFDVTPARLVTGLITERGICDASEAGLVDLFPERGAA